MTYENSAKTDALRLMSEKYPEKVRVVRVPGFSAELCSGTTFCHPPLFQKQCQAVVQL